MFFTEDDMSVDDLYEIVERNVVARVPRCVGDFIFQCEKKVPHWSDDGGAKCLFEVLRDIENVKNGRIYEKYDVTLDIIKWADRYPRDFAIAFLFDYEIYG